MSHNARFSHEQFGFRTGHSTELAALRLTDYLIKQIDQGVHHLIYIFISQMPLTPLIILYYCQSQDVRIHFLSAICPTDINMSNKIMHYL